MEPMEESPNDEPDNTNGRCSKRTSTIQNVTLCHIKNEGGPTLKANETDLPTANSKPSKG